MAQLKIYCRTTLNQYQQRRRGENKIAERIQCCATNDENWEDRLNKSNARFVIVGLPEDIGVRANYGIGGTSTAWESFLKSFLNIQDNVFLSGSDIFLLGHLDFSYQMAQAKEATLKELRLLTDVIDHAVAPVIYQIVLAGKIPIVIGGGHNNVYPIIKGVSHAKKTAVNAINLDPHADFRELEGRHSGNGFSYAFKEGLLQKYTMIGLHEAYNNSYMLFAFQKYKERILPIFWEDVFIREKYTWQQAINFSLAFVQDQYYGVELDIDSFERVLSSAVSPLGISPNQAMQYLYQVSSNSNCTWLHLPEGIEKRLDGMKNPLIGKLLSYLVQSFVKGYNRHTYE